MKISVGKISEEPESKESDPCFAPHRNGSVYYSVLINDVVVLCCLQGDEIEYLYQNYLKDNGKDT